MRTLRPKYPLLPRSTFAQLPTPSAALIGAEAWCTDYPSPSGNGCKVICSGTRWKSVSHSHCILSPESSVNGVLYPVGGAETIIGSAVHIPGGVIVGDDNLRLLATFQHPTIGSAQRGIMVRIAATEAGLLAGNNVLRFTHAATTNNNVQINKYITFLNATNLRGQTAGLSSAGVTNISQTIGTLTAPGTDGDLWMAITAMPSSDTSVLYFSASVYLEFGR